MAPFLAPVIEAPAPTMRGEIEVGIAAVIASLAEFEGTPERRNAALRRLHRDTPPDILALIELTAPRLAKDLSEASGFVRIF